MFTRLSIVMCVCVVVFFAGCTSSTKPTDTEPPATVSDLHFNDIYPDRVVLVWTIPGDDGAEGTCAAYDLRHSVDPIDESTWDDAQQVTDVPAPSRNNDYESVLVDDLDSGLVYYFALKARDEAGNWSGISNVVIGDNTPPQASVTNISENQIMAGVVSISGDVSDNHHIARAEFLVDWAPRGALTGPPWTSDWDCTQVANGTQHTIRCRATDLAGNVTYSEPLRVQVRSDVIDSIEPDVTIPINSVFFPSVLRFEIREDGGAGINFDSLFVDIYRWRPNSDEIGTRRDLLLHTWQMGVEWYDDVEVQDGYFALGLDFREGAITDPVHFVIYDGTRALMFDEICMCEFYQYDSRHGVPDKSGNHAIVVEGWLPSSE